MEMIEPNQLIFGLTQKLGYHALNVIISETELNTATTKAHREDQKQERKVEKDIMNGQKYQMSYVSKCCALFFKITHNKKIRPAPSGPA